MLEAKSRRRRSTRSQLTMSDNLGGVDVYRSQMVTSRVGRASAVLVARHVGALSCVWWRRVRWRNRPSSIFRAPIPWTRARPMSNSTSCLRLPGPDVRRHDHSLQPRVSSWACRTTWKSASISRSTTTATSPSNSRTSSPNIKWKFYKNDDMGLAAGAGVVVNTPLNSRDGQATWSYIYGNVSKKWKGDGPRVTAGRIRCGGQRRPDERTGQLRW